jgi:hypothetical protein
MVAPGRTPRYTRVGERRRISVDRCAGLDWAKDTHQVCVLGGDGEPLLQRSFAHDERDLGGMCELLVELEVKRIASNVRMVF